MRTVIVALVVVLLAVVLIEAVPVDSVDAVAKERKFKDLADVLLEAGKEAKTAGDSAPDHAGIRTLAKNLAACYEPGCDYQCQLYGYAGGFCQWGKCKCWYW